MLFAITLVIVLALSAAYFFHQWYTDELGEPEPDGEEEAEEPSA